MNNVHEYLTTCNPLRRMIFVGAMYMTTPEWVSDENQEAILDEIGQLEEQLSAQDLVKVVEAVKILITVEDFPSIDGQDLMDFLDNYQCSGEGTK